MGVFGRVSKCYFKMLRQCGKFKTERPYAYGYAKRKSTSHAILLNLVVSARLQQSQESHIRMH